MARELLMSVVTAWTDSEAKAHGCCGGAVVQVDAMRDGYTVRLRRAEVVGVFIPHEAVELHDEAAIRKRIADGCAALAAEVRMNLSEEAVR
jgi:hypothetical protein